MNKKEKAQHQFMKIMVAVCIVTVIAFAVAAYVSAWFDVNTVPVLNVIAVCLGGELLLTAALKLMGEKHDPQKKATTTTAQTAQATQAAQANKKQLG